MRRPLPETALVEPPPLPADKETLRGHYKDAQAIRASLPYDEILDRCTWCLAVGRSVKSTGAPRAALGRFCSKTCRDGYEEYEKQTWGEFRSPLADLREPKEK